MVKNIYKNIKNNASIIAALAVGIFFAYTAFVGAVTTRSPGALLQVGDVTSSIIRDNTITGSDVNKSTTITLTKIIAGAINATNTPNYLLGDTGIGTGTPKARLHIQGKGTTTEVALRIDDSTGTTTLTVLDNGNVGIGTSTPKTQLELTGKLTVGAAGIGFNDGTTQTTAPAAVPIGTVATYASSTPPTGWLNADGSSLLRAGTYANLFAVIGTTYGSADGSHFYIPNLTGKVAVGQKTTDIMFDVMGETGGATSTQMTTAQMPKHTHVMPNTNGNQAAGDAGSTNGSFSNGTTGETGGNELHPNMDPYIVLNYIIKY
ncbi:MAG: tail fiber protein [Candidatus Pacebacteria bacterium]|nr:tail fiber protein [Candidatus Paceibacterota bacterium]